jgi:hypothetical protein
MHEIALQGERLSRAQLRKNMMEIGREGDRIFTKQLHSVN